MFRWPQALAAAEQNSQPLSGRARCRSRGRADRESLRQTRIGQSAQSECHRRPTRVAIRVRTLVDEIVQARQLADPVRDLDRHSVSESGGRIGGVAEELGPAVEPERIRAVQRGCCRRRCTGSCRRRRSRAEATATHPPSPSQGSGSGVADRSQAWRSQKRLHASEVNRR